MVPSCDPAGTESDPPPGVWTPLGYSDPPPLLGVLDPPRVLGVPVYSGTPTLRGGESIDLYNSGYKLGGSQDLRTHGLAAPDPQGCSSHRPSNT